MHEIRDHIGRVERPSVGGSATRRRPLLVSVRSGAPVSMPGMMDTILNLGINDATERGLVEISGDPGFVAACRDRFVSTYREIVGVDDVPEDPFDQLRGAVEAVFRSWNGDRARSYRAHEGIPEDLGTGVTVQAMVFGNSGPDSATGVVFTRNPANGERVLYGDVLFNAQGEDVVAGTHATRVHRLPRRASAGDCRRAEASRRPARTPLRRRLRHRVHDRVRQAVDAPDHGSENAAREAALRIAVDMAEDPDFPLIREEAILRVAEHLVSPPTAASDALGGRRAVATGSPRRPGSQPERS